MIFFKLLEERLGKKNLWFGFGKDFLGHKDKTIKKIGKLDSIKIKNLFFDRSC